MQIYKQNGRYGGREAVKGNPVGGFYWGNYLGMNSNTLH